MIYQLPDHFLYWWSFFIMKTYRLKHLAIACLCCTTVTVIIMHENAPRVYFTPGPDCENNIIREIKKSKHIDIAVYSITNKNIVTALINAHNRGTKIRIITDRTQAYGKYSEIQKLHQSGIPIRINHGHKIEHNKFAIFDSNRVVTGSYNWTMNATRNNSENCVFISSKQYATRFEYLWTKYNI